MASDDDAVMASDPPGVDSADFFTPCKMQSTECADIQTSKTTDPPGSAASVIALLEIQQGLSDIGTNILMETDNTATGTHGMALFDIMPGLSDVGIQLPTDPLHCDAPSAMHLDPPMFIHRSSLIHFGGEKARAMIPSL
jgi:hypothetical protein